MEVGEELTEEQREQLKGIRLKKKQIVLAHRMKKGAAGRQAMLPKTADGERKRTTTNLKVRRPRRTQAAPGCGRCACCDSGAGRQRSRLDERFPCALRTRAPLLWA